MLDLMENTGPKEARMDFFQNINTLTHMPMIWSMHLKFLELFLKGGILDPLVHGDNAFDLMLSETLYFQELFVSFGYIFNVPVINIDAHAPNAWSSYLTGNVNPYSYVPDFKLKATDHMSFFERVHNTIINLQIVLGSYYYYLPNQDEYICYPFVVTLTNYKYVCSLYPGSNIVVLRFNHQLDQGFFSLEDGYGLVLTHPSHPNCRLFISHGGIHGMTEAIYHKVPLLMIPFVSDQYFNANFAEKEGFAYVLSNRNLTVENLLHAINAMIENPEYKKNIERRSLILKDKPLSAVDTAVYWVEYVLRHKGVIHLRPPLLDLNTFQYLILDVVVAIFLGVTASICIIYSIVRTTFKSVKSIALKSKEKCE